MQEGELVYVANAVSSKEANWFEELGIHKSSDYYTVEFDTAGGNEIDSQSIKIGKTAKKPKNPTKAGYIFLGWYYLQESGTEDNPTYEEKEFDFNTKIINNYSLYAKYSGEAVMSSFKKSMYFWKYKSVITNITFTSDATLIPNNVKDAWNIKADENCADVMAYLEDSTMSLVIYSQYKIYANYNASLYFDSFSKLETIDFSNFSTEKTFSMNSMFRHCDIIKKLDLKNFKTENVTNMSRMFSNCKALTSLNLDKFNTSNVKSMYQMFNSCNNIISIELSSFKTQNVNNMQGMFSNCFNLKSLNLSHFQTEKVTNMYGMFNECRNLNDLNISNFNTEKVTNMNCMFNKCANLISLDLSSFNTYNVTNMSRMFSNCGKLTTIYANNKFVSSNGTDSTDMFISNVKLIGECGTVYNSANVNDASYAHVDGGPSNPGYFTFK